jgi:hypothetical protein
MVEASWHQPSMGMKQAPDEAQSTSSSNKSSSNAEAFPSAGVGTSSGASILEARVTAQEESRTSAHPQAKIVSFLHVFVWVLW